VATIKVRPHPLRKTFFWHGITIDVLFVPIRWSNSRFMALPAVPALHYASNPLRIHRTRKSKK